MPRIFRLCPVAAPDDSDDREAELVAAWRQGDSAAFAEIVRIHRRRLFAVAYHKTGNVESAEDALQVAFHNANRAVARLNGSQDLANWLTAIVVNAARDESRRDVRHRRIVSRATETVERSPEQFGTSVARPDQPRRLERLELGRILTDGVASLPDPYRRAIELFHVQGLGVADIAIALGTNVNTVKTRLARGRGLLQRSLERRLREGGYL
jgi:RNA polymerase sigma-70 factor, ECF subfamily